MAAVKHLTPNLQTTCVCRLSAAHQAVLALDSIGRLQSLDQQRLCNFIGTAVTPSMPLEDAYQAIQSLSHLRSAARQAEVMFVPATECLQNLQCTCSMCHVSTCEALAGA